MPFLANHSPFEQLSWVALNQDSTWMGVRLSWHWLTSRSFLPTSGRRQNWWFVNNAIQYSGRSYPVRFKSIPVETKIVLSLKTLGFSFIYELLVPFKNCTCHSLEGILTLYHCVSALHMLFANQGKEFESKLLFVLNVFCGLSFN